MAVDTKALLDTFQKDFVATAKAKFKDKWDGLPDDVKKAIEFTAKHGARCAARVAAGENPNETPLSAELIALKANALDIEVMAKIEFRAFVDEMLATASKIGGTIFRGFIKGVVGI